MANLGQRVTPPAASPPVTHPASTPTPSQSTPTTPESPRYQVDRPIKDKFVALVRQHFPDGLFPPKTSCDDYVVGFTIGARVLVSILATTTGPDKSQTGLRFLSQSLSCPGVGRAGSHQPGLAPPAGHPRCERPERPTRRHCPGRPRQWRREAALSHLLAGLAQRICSSSSPGTPDSPQNTHPCRRTPLACY